MNDTTHETTPEGGHHQLPNQQQNHVMTDQMARYFEYKSRNMAPSVFQDLVKKKKTWLVEVACSPESRLSTEVQNQAGYEEAAVRCSQWNNFDLETGEGVKGVLQVIDSLEPEHVWLSPVCGPYSPLQAINQRTPEQVHELAEKRKRALKQYIGASCIFQHCIHKGIHVSWEWAERCQAWRLPFMQHLQKKYQPFMSITHGCRVGLRSPKNHQLMGKGWKVMSTHQHISDLLNKRCMCAKGFKHATCDGGDASMTSYYTPDFVKLVCQGLFQELTLPLLQREMEGRLNLVNDFGGGSYCVCHHLKHHESEHVCGSCIGSQGTPDHREDTTVDTHIHDQDSPKESYTFSMPLLVIATPVI